MITLAPAQFSELADLVARRVVELLDERDQGVTSALVDAATLARLLSVSRSTVYEHAAELGAIEAGNGSKPRLRFDPSTARSAWTARLGRERSEPLEPEPQPREPRRRRRRATRPGGELLPIRGLPAPEGDDAA